MELSPAIITAGGIVSNRYYHNSTSQSDELLTGSLQHVINRLVTS